MPPEVYDDLDQYLRLAADIARAAVPTGMYLAWCANLQLLAADFQQRHEVAMLRLRYREITGAEFFVSACGGRFERGILSAAGQRFTDDYYPGYLDDFHSTFGTDLNAVTDDWDHYDRLARLLMRRYLAPGRQPDPRGPADPIAPVRRRWWQRGR